MAVKNPTQWRPGSGQGFVILTGSRKIVNTAGKIIVTRAGLFVVQNPTEVIPKYPTRWELSGV